MGYNKSMSAKSYNVKYTDNSRLPAVVSAYQMITEALKALAIVKNCEVVLNRFYYHDNDAYLFNFSVFLKGKECKYLITCPVADFDNWTIRSNKWNSQRESIDTHRLSFGNFIRTTDHDKKR